MLKFIGMFSVSRFLILILMSYLKPLDYTTCSHVASVAAGNAEVPVVVNGYLYGLASGIAPGAR